MSHLVEASEVEGTVRVLIYSPQNEDLAAQSGQLLTFNLTATGDPRSGSLKLLQQAVSSSGGRTSAPADLACSIKVIEGTGIDTTTEAELNNNAEIYTLTGLRISTPKNGGIYIINGTKKMVK